MVALRAQAAQNAFNEAEEQARSWLRARLHAAALSLRRRLSRCPPSPVPWPIPPSSRPCSSVPERARLLAAPADAGVTEDDYRMTEKARRLVDQVNARLSARGATLAYAVTCKPIGPLRPRDGAVLESAISNILRGQPG